MYQDDNFKNLKNINIDVEYICTFTSYISWVNKASNWISGFHPSEKIICVDKNNRICSIGSDFKFAFENSLFPVHVYRLKRTFE